MNVTIAQKVVNIFNTYIHTGAGLPLPETVEDVTNLEDTTGIKFQATDPADLIGRYVIVRCRDAGVHAGWLVWYDGRSCVLVDSRRLWYWKPADGQKYLSGVAVAGLHQDSSLGAPLPRLLLTENCEIIGCTDAARDSIASHPTDTTR